MTSLPNYSYYSLGNQYCYFFYPSELSLVAYRIAGYPLATRILLKFCFRIYLISSNLVLGAVTVLHLVKRGGGTPLLYTFCCFMMSPCYGHIGHFSYFGNPPFFSTLKIQNYAYVSIFFQNYNLIRGIKEDPRASNYTM